MEYFGVDEVAAMAEKGPRVVIESAYRLIPVHPQDYVLQGMR